MPPCLAYLILYPLASPLPHIHMAYPPWQAHTHFSLHFTSSPGTIIITQCLVNFTLPISITLSPVTVTLNPDTLYYIVFFSFFPTTSVSSSLTPSVYFLFCFVTTSSSPRHHTTNHITQQQTPLCTTVDTSPSPIIHNSTLTSSY